MAPQWMLRAPQWMLRAPQGSTDRFRLRRSLLGVREKLGRESNSPVVKGLVKGLTAASTE
eukprot:2892610-Pyramimonas_sp.AAC.1